MSEGGSKPRQITLGRLFIVTAAVAVTFGFLRAKMGTEFLPVQLALAALVGMIAALATKKDFDPPLRGSPGWIYRGGTIGGLGIGVLLLSADVGWIKDYAPEFRILAFGFIVAGRYLADQQDGWWRGKRTDNEPGE